LPNASDRSLPARRLKALTPDILAGLRRGIEKESLRVRPDGSLADTPHPPGLGSPLTHPRITTDFSESQIELITGVHEQVESCARELTEMHQFVHRQLDGETLWCSSMPCRLPPDDAIPIARFGTSNAGRLKEVYRTGLAHRYGRRLQAISGVHYNFSLPDAAWPLLQRADGAGGSPDDHRNAAYFGLMRNFRRRAWLVMYLFGASPAVCRSFVEGRAHRLVPLAPDTLHLPGATSLRMGPLGYQSEAQASHRVSFDGLAAYVESLRAALAKPYPRYESIGVRDGAAYRQLSTSLLQIENEFYGTIRPKRAVAVGGRVLNALEARGVEYVEARCLDVDPFSPIGVEATTMRFMDVFLLQCLLDESPPVAAGEEAAIARNQHRVAEEGRDAGVRLLRAGRDVALREWASELLHGCLPIAEALDDAHGTSDHGEAVARALAAVADPSLTPSARVLSEIAPDGGSFVRFAQQRSVQHRDTLLAMPFDAGTDARYRELAEESLVRQRRLEAEEDVPFEAYRLRYLLGAGGEGARA
jgi:glutamate--cysteine ligase